jgi:hypothetical protein
MLFQLPPALPSAVPAAVVGQTWAISDQSLGADCQRGSRDCFPADRVGAGDEVEVVAVAVVVPRSGSAFTF